MKKYLAGICTYNEGSKIRQVIERFSDYDCYDVLIIDDGSTDGSLKCIPPDTPIHIITNARTMGAGYGTRQIIRYAKEKGYPAIFFVSGNNKDDPRDIAALRAGMEEGYDLVQGSRYLPGGEQDGMPLYRRIATSFIHPCLFSLLAGRKITDSTNGFRAMRTAIAEDQRMDIDQSWLDQYELEPYLFLKAILLGYKVQEVPVRKIYPSREQGYTKMKPFSGWWSILRPLVYLGLGMRK